MAGALLRRAGIADRAPGHVRAEPAAEPTEGLADHACWRAAWPGPVDGGSNAAHAGLPDLVAGPVAAARRYRGGLLRARLRCARAVAVVHLPGARRRRH